MKANDTRTCIDTLLQTICSAVDVCFANTDFKQNFLRPIRKVLGDVHFES